MSTNVHVINGLFSSHEEQKGLGRIDVPDVCRGDLFTEQNLDSLFGDEFDEGDGFNDE